MYLITIIVEDDKDKALILDKLQDLAEDSDIGAFETRVQEIRVDE